MDKRTRNVLVSPIVLFVRFPLMIALSGVILVGMLAENAYEWVSDHIPGLRR